MITTDIHKDKVCRVCKHFEQSCWYPLSNIPHLPFSEVSDVMDCIGLED